MEYVDISPNHIEKIQTLWEKNRFFHEACSKYFSRLYQNMTFDERKLQFLYTDEKNIKITVVYEKNNEPIAYCISAFHESEGEIKSIHVEESYRSKGIGTKLLNLHLDYLKSNHCSSIFLFVDNNNLSAITLYQKLGFQPNFLEMRLP